MLIAFNASLFDALLPITLVLQVLIFFVLTEGAKSRSIQEETALLDKK